jgi:hypothetical protein
MMYLRVLAGVVGRDGAYGCWCWLLLFLLLESRVAREEVGEVVAVTLNMKNVKGM